MPVLGADGRPEKTSEDFLRIRMAERALELGIIDDDWDDDFLLSRLKTSIEATINYNLDPAYSQPRGPEHHYIGDENDDQQGAEGQH